LREKIVAEASGRYVIIADETKLSPRLGARRLVPVEVVTFGWRRHEAYLKGLGGDARLRMRASGEPFITDGGNYIVDCRFTEIAPDLATAMKRHAGIIEHGIFSGYASEVIVAGAGGVRRLTRKEGA
jgi:ribose 5-phosphate isomerase A